MPLTQSQIRNILDHEKIILTKSLGQNFLHDLHQLQKIGRAAQLSPEDKILEIGPGLGPLTELLLASGAHVTAIEKDQRLIRCLLRRLEPGPRFQIIHDDALRYLREHTQWSSWKVVSNLPYSVASPLLVELALTPDPPSRIVATLQLEVAQRAVSRAGSSDYGLLSLLLQLKFEPGPVFKIPPACFFPPPDVHSACLTLQRRPQPLLPPPLQPAFYKIVRRSFSQRRKMMIKLLRLDWPADKLNAAFAALPIDPAARAETISLSQFAALTQILSSDERSGGRSL